MKPSREVLGAKIARQARSALRLPRRLAHALHVGLQILHWTATFQLRRGLRARRDARIIRRSGLFDVAHYLSQCDGDRHARRDPIEHYLRVGAARGLAPSPLFDGAAYAERHPEEIEAGENPLAHFIRSRAAANGAAAGLASPPGPGGVGALGPGSPLRASPSPRSILFIAARPPVASGPIEARAGDARALFLLKLLRELGYPVTFVSVAPEPSADEAGPLRTLGVVLVTGLEAATAHLAAEGHSYRAVLLSGLRDAWRLVLVVRAHAPQASLLLDCWAPPVVDEIAAASVDAVLVRDPRRRDELLRRVPAARVEIVPSLPDALAPSRTGDDLFLPVVKGRLELAIGTTADLAAAARPAPAVSEPSPGGEGLQQERREPARRAERPGRSVLAVGVYLADKRNNAAEIARRLGEARDWQVEQRWIAVGRSAIPAPLAQVTAWRQRSRVPKFVLLNRLLAKLDVGRHEFVLVCDDDIGLPAGFVDAYLDLVTRHDLALAQPARTHGSYTDHFIVERLDGLVARRTRFVEIGPLFSMRRDAVPLLTPFDECSPMGWGYDYVWPVLMERAGLRMGIVDATPVAHDLREPITLYDDRDAAIAMRTLLSRHPHLQRHEAFSVLEAYA